MKTKELIEWLDTKALCEDYPIVKEIVARLKHYDTLLAFNEKVRNVTLEPKK